MPITRVPVIHKFGIISEKHRLELQERLFQKKCTASADHHSLSACRNPIEVTDEFIHKFNSARNLDEKEKYESEAYKRLERVKRRAGFSTKGLGRHVNLALAWAELAQLVECRGVIQQECLDVLIVTLNQSPLIPSHVPAIFFLGESILYWLRTDAMYESFLKIKEIKLLKVSELVFARLFYHHMTGSLEKCTDLKNRLYNYLDGLPSYLPLYTSYPDALFALHFIIQVGKMILSDSVMDSGEVKEEDILQNPGKWADSSIFQNDALEIPKPPDKESMTSPSLSLSVHNLSPTLWHALDMWRCLKQNGDYDDALNALAMCAQDLGNDSWLDGVVALSVLAESAKICLPVLKVMQNLAHIVYPPLDLTSAVQDADKMDAKANEEKVSFKPTILLNVIKPLSNSSETSKYNSDMKQQKYQMQNTEGMVKFDWSKKSGMDSEELLPQDSRLLYQSTRVPREAIHRSATFGKSLDPRKLTLPFITNSVVNNIPGIYGWRWEFVFIYTRLLRDVCLHGATSQIQKLALMGTHKDITMYHYGLESMQSSGLVDLAFFHTPNDKDKEDENKWNWRIRFGALRSLIQICQSLAGNKARDGLYNMAWSILLKAHSMEKDRRVLQALRVGYVYTDMKNSNRQKIPVLSSTLAAEVASGLSALYLPPLRAVTIKKRPPTKAESAKPCPVDRQTRKKVTPARTPWRREEIGLGTRVKKPPVDYCTRTNFNLWRVIEDQWRKNVMEEMEEEVKEVWMKILNEKIKNTNSKNKENGSVTFEMAGVSSQRE